MTASSTNVLAFIMIYLGDRQGTTFGANSRAATSRRVVVDERQLKAVGDNETIWFAFIETRVSLIIQF